MLHLVKAAELSAVAGIRESQSGAVKLLMRFIFCAFSWRI